MVYELRTYGLRYGGQQAYVDAFGEHVAPHLAESGYKLVGAWLTSLGDGARRDLELMMEWDGVEGQQVASKVLHAIPTWRDFAAAGSVQVAQAKNTFLDGYDFAPVGEPVSDGSHVYEMRRYTCRYGELDKYLNIFKPHLDGFHEAGFTTVGAWTPFIGAELRKDFLWMVRWDDLAARDAAFAKVRAQPWYGGDLAKAEVHIESAATRLLEPVPFSPAQ